MGSYYLKISRLYKYLIGKVNKNKQPSIYDTEVDGCSAPGRVGGGEAGTNREQIGVEGLNMGEQ